jgi:hypothetical protein
VDRCSGDHRAREEVTGWRLYLIAIYIQNGYEHGDEKSDKNDKNDKNENVRIARIVGTSDHHRKAVVGNVVRGGGMIWHKWRRWQHDILVPKSSHVSRSLPRMLQNPQMQICEKLQMLKMLQVQLRESCNNDGLRNSRFIGCEGAMRFRPDDIPGVPTLP